MKLSKEVWVYFFLGLLLGEVFLCFLALVDIQEVGLGFTLENIIRIFKSQNIYFVGSILFPLAWGGFLGGFSLLRVYAKEERLQRVYFQTILDSLHDFLFILDKKGIVLSVNSYACSMLDCREEELKGKSIFKVLEDPDKKTEMIFKKFLSETEPIELSFKGKNLKKIPVLLTMVFFEYWDVHKCILTAKDLTSEKKLEGQLKAIQKLEAIGKLAGGVAHEFNNQLGIILVSLQSVLEELGPNHGARKNIERAIRGARMGAKIAKELLVFSRPDLASKKETTLSDWNRFLKYLEDIFIGLVEERIEFSVSAEKNLWSVQMTPKDLQQILINFIVNAQDAIEGNGKIHLKLKNVLIEKDIGSQQKKAGSYVCLELQDSGSGISSADLEKIFDPFFSTKPIGEGTGLGLSVAHGLVKQVGGWIEVFSEINKGTLFKVWIPALELIGTEGKVQQKFKKEEKDTKKRFKILLVEDNEMHAESLKEFLTKKGHQVMVAENGKKALAALEKTAQSFDIIVSDWVMPQMGGEHLLKETEKKYPHLPFLFITGYAPKKIDKNIAFILKPFLIEDFLKKIDEVIENKKEKLQPSLKAS